MITSFRYDLLASYLLRDKLALIILSISLLDVMALYGLDWTIKRSKAMLKKIMYLLRKIYIIYLSLCLAALTLIASELTKGK